VARGTQHRKRRPQANARVATAPAAKPSKPKVKHESWEDQLFFARIRAHAKWVFVLLALAFALGFVFFGVGSGSTGISDVLQNFFNRNSSSGTSIGSLEKKTREHPKDPKVWRDLATRYEQDQRTSDAIRALERYTGLRAKDADALQELAGLYSQQATTFRDEASAAQAQSQVLSPASVFQPASTSPIGRAFADPTALQDPVANAVSQTANTKASDAYTKLGDTEKRAEKVYQRLARLNPGDATTQVQLGEAAQSAGDTKTAIAAYKRFLKLAPTDPLAPAVKQQLKQLTGGAATITSG
jgi:cytochrome c-type biogenesis protein CcmH/NrfG